MPVLWFLQYKSKGQWEPGAAFISYVADLQDSLAKDDMDANSLHGGRWRRNCRGLLNTKKPCAAWEAPQLNMMGGWEIIQYVLVLLLSPPDIPRWPYQRWYSGLGGSLL